jgi:aspartyl aminopeptidase
MNTLDQSKDLIDFIKAGTSPYHTVLEVKRRLLEAGFLELVLDHEWRLDFGKSYFVSPYPSVLFGFSIPKHIDYNQVFRFVTAHTDQPCFRVKPSPEMSVGGYLKLNTETYGGPILNTWLDRPLSMAGRVAIKSDMIMKPRIEFIDFKKSILTIPNLAIHMNREVNKGVELNKQTDTIPLAGLLQEHLNKDNFLMGHLAHQLGVKIEDILDFDLYIYVNEMGEIIGLNNEFISAPRLDDLAMVHAATQAMIETKPTRGVNVIAFFDHEEVGSKSKEGADSMLFHMVLKRMANAIYLDDSQFQRALTQSFMISADMAHALHPNRPEKHDPTNQPELGKGVVVKISGNQSYATDSESIAIFQQICEAGEVPYQKYVNRSDNAGGKTLGPLATSYLPLRTVDVGNPMLGMHSARELIGVKDHGNMIKTFNTFFGLS